MKKSHKPKKRTVKAWADIGSHEGIFEFVGGPVAVHYPYLLHIYSRKVKKYLVPVTITYTKEIISKKICT